MLLSPGTHHLLRIKKLTHSSPGTKLSVNFAVPPLFASQFRQRAKPNRPASTPTRGSLRISSYPLTGTNRGRLPNLRHAQTAQQPAQGRTSTDTPQEGLQPVAFSLYSLQPVYFSPSALV